MRPPFDPQNPIQISAHQGRQVQFSRSGGQPKRSLTRSINAMS